MSIRERTLPSGWYPSNSAQCKKEIENFLEYYKDLKIGRERKFIAGVVPHAGWFFSGRLACKVISILSEMNNPELVVVFGGHMRKKDKPIYYKYDYWETPFGNIEIDIDLLDKLNSKMQGEDEQPFYADNTIEVQLPFVKYFFKEAKLLPIRPPLSSDATIIGEYVYNLAKDKYNSVVVIASTDLTHYGNNYGFAPKGYGEKALKWVKDFNDKEFINFCINLQAEELIEHSIKSMSACSAGSVASLIGYIKNIHSDKGVLVDYYTSYDIMPNSSFVGYAGILY